MHFIKSILVFISSLVLCGNTLAKNPSSATVDSLFQQMSAADKLKTMTLLNSSFADSSALTNYDRRYFKAPLPAVSFDHSSLVIVELDETFRPFASLGKLPSMATLSAIREEALLAEYLKFLEKMCFSRGIDKLVIPDDTWSHPQQSAFIQKVFDSNNDFFIRRSEIGFENSWKKRNLKRLFEEKKYWILDAEALPKAFSKIDKYGQSILTTSPQLPERIKLNLANQLALPQSSLDQVPDRLYEAISKAAVIPLTQKTDIFPLKRDTICLITAQPQSMLAAMLHKYAYVKTDLREIQKSNAPIIIHNYHLPIATEVIRNRTTIYTGIVSSLDFHVSYLDAALIYHEQADVHDYLIPQILFGAANATGISPVAETWNQNFSNQPLLSHHYIGYAPGETFGLDENALREIEAILQEAVSSGSTPGGQLAVSVGGSVIMEQAFGHLTYDSLITTDNQTMYDLASVSKISGTLLAVMKLYEIGLIDLDLPIYHYLPQYRNSNKENITIRALLSHNAGLRSYVPFWQRILSADLIETFYYEDEDAVTKDDRSYGMKPTTSMIDTLNGWIINSSLTKYDSLPGYQYSDIGFMMLHQIVEAVTHEPMNVFLDREFYHPLNLSRLTYNPLNAGYERFEIAPTEHDYYFRNELVWGEVHDRNAAIFGGVAGHAGIFSNASELLVIMQMILQNGHYGNTQLLRPETIAYFNKQYYPNNRRALGWDKKDDEIGNASSLASNISFGHSGFTGTLVWADPTYDLVFVFLSNRIHPSANNNQLISRNIRTRPQDVVYQAIRSNTVN